MATRSYEFSRGYNRGYGDAARLEAKVHDLEQRLAEAESAINRCLDDILAGDLPHMATISLLFKAVGGREGVTLPPEVGAMERALTVAEGKIAAVKELRERWYKASKLEPRNEVEMVARRSVQEAIDQIDTILAGEEQSAG